MIAFFIFKSSIVTWMNKCILGFKEFYLFPSIMQEFRDLCILSIDVTLEKAGREVNPNGGLGVYCMLVLLGKDSEQKKSDFC